MPDTINFAFNSAELSDEARSILQKQANFIKQFPEVRFRVFGHTDKVGSNGYNQRLGLRRAQAAVAYLSSLGISRSRLEAVVSYGETKPLIATNEAEVRNRRTVTEVFRLCREQPACAERQVRRGHLARIHHQRRTSRRGHYWHAVASRQRRRRRLTPQKTYGLAGPWRPASSFPE